MRLTKKSVLKKSCDYNWNTLELVNQLFRSRDQTYKFEMPFLCRVSVSIGKKSNVSWKEGQVFHSKTREEKFSCYEAKFAHAHRYKHTQTHPNTLNQSYTYESQKSKIEKRLLSGELGWFRFAEFSASGELGSIKVAEFSEAGNSKIGELEAGNSKRRTRYIPISWTEDTWLWRIFVVIGTHIRWLQVNRRHLVVYESL